jgi:hypothetical protein
MNRITVAALALVVSATFMQTASARVSDTDIVEAYEYMLGRWLVLRQEALDFKEGFQWNEIIHREPGGVAWANPNLDVAYSEAWIAVDDKSCTLIDLPEIKGRYHTVQALNGWGEVTANLNERNYPRHPFGKFALCLKGAKVTLPKGTQRVDLPSRKSRVLARIELGANPAEAISLQKKITMKATGVPKIEKAVVEPVFTNDKLPGIEAFDKTDEILASEADINPGMTGVQENARSIAAAAAEPAERARMDDVIRKKAIPTFLAEIPKSGKTVNGWIHPRIVGNFRSDYLMRTITNFTGIWANNSKEAVYFGALGIDGSQTYLQTFPEDALPTSKARYFWSVVAVDGEKYRVIPNRLNRFLFNKQSALEFNPDGSLTLAFAPKQPDGVPESNWLPTPAGKKYNMTYRFYGPSADIASGKYYPPPLAKE